MSRWMFGLCFYCSLVPIIRKCFSTPNNVGKALLQIGQANAFYLLSSISFSVISAISYGSCVSELSTYCGVDLDLWELAVASRCRKSRGLGYLAG